MAHKINRLTKYNYLDMESTLEDNLNILDETVNENEEFRYSITSYGADYTLDSIVARIEKGKIFVPPFQRKYVWTHVQASRFIESLILGLPVPGIFLSKEENTGKLLIIDGQQRILSIANFYKGVFGEKKFRLKGVQEDLENKTCDDLKEADKNRLDDSILHATVVKQDAPSEDNSSIYMIFERLNTGGTPLQPQEIRACVYYGLFNKLLTELVKNDSWRKIFGEENKRMKEQELILRFFALYYGYEEYKKVLKSFLNSYMASNRDLKKQSKDKLSNLFNLTIDNIFNALGEKAFKTGNRMNAAMLDAVMIGVAKRLEVNPNINHNLLNTQYILLTQQKDFRAFIESGTSSEQSVKGRIANSIQAFNSI